MCATVACTYFSSVFDPFIFAPLKLSLDLFVSDSDTIQQHCLWWLDQSDICENPVIFPQGGTSLLVCFSTLYGLSAGQCYGGHAAISRCSTGFWAYEKTEPTLSRLWTCWKQAWKFNEWLFSSSSDIRECWSLTLLADKMWGLWTNISCRFLSKWMFSTEF